MRRILFLFLTILSLSSHSFVYSQDLRNPFNFPILLSGNFGELRSNHFHSGIDFKTQGVEGKPVHAVQDGYVSRIAVSPWGYGNVLYLNHPDGTTTVYAHLQKFNNAIDTYVKEQQYQQETFTINLYPDAELFPVRRGDIIALGGNSGSSGGPHLHFEVRDTESEEVLDPIEYFKDKIKDTTPPRIQGIMIYPVEGRGVVNGSAKKQEFKLNGTSVSGKIEAWGEIGLAVKAYDYMDGTSNIYGVKEVVLKADSQQIFRSYIDRYAFSETRYLNSFTDYEEWVEHKSFYMKSFVEPGNRLRFIESKNRGYININENKTYSLIYTLMDAYGNQAEIIIEIEGKEQDIPAPETMNRHYFHWKSENRFGSKGIRLTIPKDNLYDDLYFSYAVKEDSTALAATHTLHNQTMALHKWGQLSLRLQTDTIDNKKQYGIVRIKNGKTHWVGGEYRNGWIDADIRELGSSYSIRRDITPPVITPINKESWASKQSITFRIVDNLSGVKSYRGEIDGEYVLFEMDGKRAMIYYDFDKQRLSRGEHTLKMVAEDACGNTSEFTHTFVW